MCQNFAQLGQFVHIDNDVFRTVKASTPGQYTFILPATKEVPRQLLHPKKKTVGVRIPDHPPWSRRSWRNWANRCSPARCSCPTRPSPP